MGGNESGGDDSIGRDGMFEIDEEPLETVLSELKRRLSSLLGSRLARLVLYGSRARGDYDKDSDVDVAIIVRDLDRATKNEVLETVADVELTHLAPLSTIVLSEDSFRELLNRERRIALDIEQEGIPL
jgi:predicted nucleotidyltransferase